MGPLEGQDIRAPGSLGVGGDGTAGCPWEWGVDARVPWGNSWVPFRAWTGYLGDTLGSLKKGLQGGTGCLGALRGVGKRNRMLRSLGGSTWDSLWSVGTGVPGGLGLFGWRGGDQDASVPHG